MWQMFIFKWNRRNDRFLFRAEVINWFNRDLSIIEIIIKQFSNWLTVNYLLKEQHVKLNKNI